MKSGPVIIIEDDADDKYLFEKAIRSLGVMNEIIWFQNTADAWHFLKTSTHSPFIIFSDINLPRETGIEFKGKVDQDPELRKKSIPFVIYSTSANEKDVDEAYTKMTIQGFFKKAHDYEQIKKDLKIILDYWAICKHPNA